jgi:hypothetical protein
LRVSLRKFPDNLPLLMSVFTAIPFCVFLITTLYAAGQIGQPGSGAGIGYAFVPVITAIVAIVFFFAGISVRSWIARTYPGPVVMTGRALGILAAAFIFLVIAAGVAGWDATAVHEATRQPYVTVDK